MRMEPGVLLTVGVRLAEQSAVGFADDQIRQITKTPIRGLVPRSQVARTPSHVVVSAGGASFLSCGLSPCGQLEGYSLPICTLTEYSAHPRGVLTLAEYFCYNRNEVGMRGCVRPSRVSGTGSLARHGCGYTQLASATRQFPRPVTTAAHDGRRRLWQACLYLAQAPSRRYS